MKTQLIEEAYRIARERYAAVGVDTDEALEKLQRVSLSRYLALPEGEGAPDWAQGRLGRHKDRHVIFNVRLAGEPGREFAIWPQGQRAAWPASLLRALAGEMPADAMGREVMVVWLCHVAAAAGVRMSIAVPPDGSAGPLMLSLT